MCDVVVIAWTAEWLTATLHSTIIADQKSAVGALGRSAFATWRYICPIARRVFDLTELTKYRESINDGLERAELTEEVNCWKYLLR